jgi:hypothetical protein
MFEGSIFTLFFYHILSKTLLGGQKHHLIVLIYCRSLEWFKLWFWTLFRWIYNHRWCLLFFLITLQFIALLCLILCLYLLLRFQWVSLSLHLLISFKRRLNDIEYLLKFVICMCSQSAMMGFLRNCRHHNQFLFCCCILSLEKAADILSVSILFVTISKGKLNGGGGTSFVTFGWNYHSMRLLIQVSCFS